MDVWLTLLGKHKTTTSLCLPCNPKELSNSRNTGLHASWTTTIKGPSPPGSCWQIHNLQLWMLQSVRETNTITYFVYTSSFYASLSWKDHLTIQDCQLSCMLILVWSMLGWFIGLLWVQSTYLYSSAFHYLRLGFTPNFQRSTDTMMSICLLKSECMCIMYVFIGVKMKCCTLHQPINM